MTVTQMAVAAGMLTGLGVALLLWRLLPAQPQLSSALERLNPDRRSHDTRVLDNNRSMQDRIGIYLQRRVPTGGWLKIPTKELALLQIPVHRFLGEKALFAVTGLIFPPVTTLLFSFWVAVPPVIPVAASLGLAVGLSFLPNYNAHDDAKAAREEFTRALSAYIDGVAIDRDVGMGSTKALNDAAAAGDSWVFQRIREELARGELAGITAWDGLALLADELGLPELTDLGDIMRLSNDQGAAVYTTLRARSASLRTALLTGEQTRANAAGERMTIPASMLGLVFLALLATPAALRIFFPGGG